MDETTRTDIAQPAITQEMIDLYDEYTHLTLDRRGFMDKLTRLAGSAAAAAAIVPVIAPNKAAAAIVSPEDGRLKTEMITFAGPKGQVKGYFVRPTAATGKIGNVVVVHENRGMNPHIQDIARRVALEGFNALAVDLMSGLGGTPADENQAAQMFTQVNAGDAVADTVAAANYLRGRPDGNGKVGAVGFCWGGGIINQLAVADPKLAAGVAYYGQQPKAEQVPSIKAKMLLHYGGLDERIDAGIPAYEEALKKAGTSYQIFVYQGANHAFNNDTSAARYDKAAADIAWSRTIALFKETLA